MQTVIRFDQVCFSYRMREVLHHVSFDIDQSDMVAIVGPNGGGKTTLIKLMLGLLKPLRGKVELFGQSPEEQSFRVGYVPQYLEFDSQYPVTSNDVVSMGIYHPDKGWLSRKASQDRIQTALATVGCERLAQQSFATLSGGEKQKVMIARALAGDTHLLVLDEPTANVDTQAEHDIYEIFKKCHERLPVVFVSHNLSVVTRHVTQVICVNGTAVKHSRESITQNTIQELYGGELAVLSHGQACHITDPSRILGEAHQD